VQIGEKLSDLGTVVSRYGLVLVIFWIGAMKFTAYEANGVQPLVANRLTVPMMAWGGRSSFGSHCIDSAKAIATKAQGGVIEQCGHWVFQERTDFICDELDRFWAGNV
jgi:pimeloyl-ACP methyl ester carboxylesterase